jgi:hypothetical protein
VIELGSHHETFGLVLNVKFSSLGFELVVRTSPQMNSAKTTVEVEAQPTGTTSKPKQEKDVYLDSILGPKVSHLHAGKISKD